MNARILLLRPEPGASQSAERARAMGLEPVVAPLFSILSAAWDAPAAGDFDAVLLTSANAARHGGTRLAHYTHLPCFAVGEATAEAARAAGFAEVHTGPGDAAALLKDLAPTRDRHSRESGNPGGAGDLHGHLLDSRLRGNDGGEQGNDGGGTSRTRLLHLCGREHVAAARDGIVIVRVPVYAADAVDRLPDAAFEALETGALPLLHSPRAGALFAKLVDEAGLSRDRISLAAISAAAADAAGDGWARVAIADAPRDEALLALAARLLGF